MVATRSTSASVRADPLGRHSPSRKTASATAPPRIGDAANTGWRCSGFHAGRASMSWVSRCAHTAAGVVPAWRVTFNTVKVGGISVNQVEGMVVETGLKVKVPLFVKEGDMIKIDTQTSSYLGRA